MDGYSSTFDRDDDKIPHTSSRFIYHPVCGWSREQPQPGSLFQRIRELEKRDPGNEVGNIRFNFFSDLQGRISHSTIQEAISGLDRSNCTCFICGPPPMIQDVTDILRKLDIAEHRIHFEKWW